MKIITYHRSRQSTAQDTEFSLHRAEQKGRHRRSGWKWTAARFLFLGIAGPLLHQLAPVLVQYPVLPGLVPVNESIWEHQKLLLFPALLFGITERIVRGPVYRGLLTTYAEQLLAALFLMVAGFYTYSGILGVHTLTLDVLLYELCALTLSLRIGARAAAQKKSSLPGLVILLLLTGCFCYFTYHPIQLGIFRTY